MYINDVNNKIPDDKILIVPHSLEEKTYQDEIVFPLKGNAKRDWFTSHFYYCLPLTIGNQYGFGIKSLRNFDVTWEGGESYADIKFLDENNSNKQFIDNHFGSGIVTIQNRFAIKTPVGVNTYTMQPPNHFIPGIQAMTGVIETDQIRRDFTFNLKITIPNFKVSIREGDLIAAFLPIPRHFVDKFSIGNAEDFFSTDIIKNEIEESAALGRERVGEDTLKNHMAGRRYFNGVHTDGSTYPDHQKRLG